MVSLEWSTNGVMRVVIKNSMLAHLGLGKDGGFIELREGGD